MAIHAVDKLMEQTRSLAVEYYQATGQTLPVSIELARYDAVRLLDLETPKDKMIGVDAVGTESRDGRLLQIKGRVIFDDSKTSYRIGQVNSEGEWESLLLVLFDAAYMPRDIYEVFTRSNG